MTTTQFVALDELSVEQLVQISQGLGHDIARLREQRLHIRQKIDARLKADQDARIRAQIEKLQAKISGTDASARGTVLAASSSARRATKR